MNTSQTYRDLDAWKVAMKVVELTYAITADFPDAERYDLISQMRRSSVSVPSNIAEGQGRGTTRFGLQFIRVAIGSVAELDTQLELARRLNFADAARTRELDGQLQRIRQLLYGMRREHERRLAGGAACFGVLLLGFLRLVF